MMIRLLMAKSRGVRGMERYHDDDDFFLSCSPSTRRQLQEMAEKVISGTDAFISLHAL